MRSLLRQIAITSSRPNNGWLTLLLLLAVLVPSACLVWFMNQAVRNEKLAVRQVLMEAYRENLLEAQGRVEAWGAQLARTMPTNLQSGAADAVIMFDASGRVIFPAPEHATNADPAAVALQGRVRDLSRLGKTNEALRLIMDAMSDGRVARAVDEHGRLILPSLELSALEHTNSPALLDNLRNQLNKDDNAMPSQQRRFLMRRLTGLFPGQVSFPALAALDLAARYIDAAPEPAPTPKLQATALPGIWQLGSDDGRMALLFETQTLQARLREAAALRTTPSAVSLAVAPPGAVNNFLLAVPAGENFPGWQLAFTLKDGDVFKTAADEQVASYIWIGALAMVVVVVLALLGAGLLRRQAAVAQLKNDLLANVTHELKTPLSAMRLLVDTLLQTQPLHEETARQYLQLIAAENLRLSRLIDNFLAFSRIERNKLSFDFAPVGAGAIAERAAAAVRERFAASGCQFTLRAAPGLPPVLADGDAMVTVLLNLLDNAWKYSGEEKKITLTAGAENGHVVFAVQDNGIGLSPRESKRIFRRFYQVDQRLARTGGGCGLGLSIVQFIVTAHHGAIRVESELERGSTFTITLPVASEASA